MYEGRPINKLQNGIILLNMKNPKYRFCTQFNSELINSCEFDYDDVTAASSVNDKYGDATTESIP